MLYRKNFSYQTTKGYFKRYQVSLTPIEKQKLKIGSTLYTNLSHISTSRNLRRDKKYPITQQESNLPKITTPPIQHIIRHNLIHIPKQLTIYTAGTPSASSGRNPHAQIPSKDKYHPATTSAEQTHRILLLLSNHIFQRVEFKHYIYRNISQLNYCIFHPQKYTTSSATISSQSLQNHIKQPKPDTIGCTFARSFSALPQYHCLQ